MQTRIRQLLLLGFCVLINLSAYADNAQQVKQLVIQATKDYQAQRFPKAMRQYIKAVELAEQYHLPHSFMTANGYIANIYTVYGDYDRALHYLQRGYDMAVEQKDSVMQVNYLSNIVNVYCKKGDSQQARKYFVKEQACIPNQDKNLHTYYVMYDKARIEIAEKKYQAAIASFDRACKFAQERGLPQEFVLYQYGEIGNTAVKIQAWDTAFVYAQRGLELAEKLENVELQANAYHILMQYYKANGKHEEENLARRMFNALSDSVYDVQNLFNASTLLFEYENKKNSEHIQQLNGTVSQQLHVIVTISILLIIILVLALFMIRNNRKLREAHRLLIDKNTELQQRNDQNRLLLVHYLQQQENKDVHIDTDKAVDSTGNLNQWQKSILLAKITEILNDLSVITQPDFSLYNLAEKVKSNTKYVSMVINETYHKNFKSLLNEIRIQEAARRLTDPQYAKLTIQAIYEDLGYNNAVSFIRSFKRVYGMTPSEYQNLATKKVSEKDKD